jgi:hypothetical protein
MCRAPSSCRGWLPPAMRTTDTNATGFRQHLCLKPHPRSRIRSTPRFLVPPSPVSDAPPPFPSCLLPPVFRQCLSEAHHRLSMVSAQRRHRPCLAPSPLRGLAEASPSPSVKSPIATPVYPEATGPLSASTACVGENPVGPSHAEQHLLCTTFFPSQVLGACRCLSKHCATVRQRRHLG